MHFSRFTNPVNLKTLIDLIDETEWTALDVDVKAAAFEGLLEKAASEGKKGAGQYFTPRLLIQAIVRCMRPDPRSVKEFSMCDPACGSGGFLVVAYEWLMQETKGGALDRELAKRIRKGTYYGQELVPRPRRLALMNLYLHGLDPVIRAGDSIYEAPENKRFDVILTNPPFGTKGANQAPDREDFTIATSNKQLNFLQHVLTLLKPGGRAAVVVPDNCLFADQAGEVFKILTEDCSLHTVVRLPNGTFSPYSPGTKTNVVFFTKDGPTDTVWLYDARTNVPHITKQDRPLAPEHFEEFEKCFGKDPNGRAKRRAEDSAEDRWRSFSIAEVKAHDYKLDGFKWLKDQSLDNFGYDLEPQELAGDAIAELEAAIQDLNSIITILEKGSGIDKAAGGGKAKHMIGKVHQIQKRKLSTPNSEVPEGWISAQLRDIARTRKGKKPFRLSEHETPSYIPYIDIEAFETGKIKRYADPASSVLVSMGDVIVVWDGARSGLCGISPMSGALGSTLALIRTPLYGPFLRRVIEERYNHINTNHRETGIPHVDPEFFWGLEFGLPPLEEQKRIATRIESLVAKIRATGQRLATFRRKNAVCEAALIACGRNGVILAVHFRPPAQFDRRKRGVVRFTFPAGQDSARSGSHYRP